MMTTHGACALPSLPRPLPHRRCLHRTWLVRELPLADTQRVLRSVHALLPVGSGTGASFEGRLTVAGIQSITAARVPAFLKDVVPGVRAWSPPV